ncbi:MAG TPA: CCA tRNA nucleotidyltransferase [Gemmatimonadales bacterium]|nr:CCA tRNA nucleotidyltransferase [Gemmatimonadales bacterium]
MDFPELQLSDEVVGIVETLEKAGFETWAVGGALRDRLLGLEHPDVDIATAATPDHVLQLFKRTVPVGVEHGTVGVLGKSGRLYEVTTFRRDVRTDGRHAEVEFGVSLVDDLARRDFTINALAYHPIRQEWQDPFDGRGDLKAGVVRAVGDPAARFREDYLRILRAIRFAARFGFSIEAETWAAAVDAAPGLSGLSAERVRDEWFKGLRTARSIPGLIRLWREVGAAGVWLPELETAWQYADPEIRDPVVLTSVVVRNPADVLLRLRASNDEINRARAITRNPAAPGSQGGVGARRWLATVGGAADDLLLAARYREGKDPSWAGEVAGVRARGEATARSALAITGDDLMAMGLAAGPALGATLDRLLEAVIIDPGLNHKDKLLELARR